MLQNKRVCLWACLIVELTIDQCICARPNSRGSKGNFVIYADDLSTADIAVFEAERFQQHLIHYFKLESSPNRIPVVLVLGNPAKKENINDGVVRIFSKNFSLKLQVNWDELPISLNSFYQGWARALCTRLAIEHLFLQNDHAFQKKVEPELRIPIWLTAGVAGMFAEPLVKQENQSRVILLAKVEPDLSLAAVLRELEGRFELNSVQHALATMLCGVLTQDRQDRERFLEDLNWGTKLTAREWLGRILLNKNLDEWWREIWKNQANQFSWVKLGYLPTLRWIREWENLSNMLKQSPSKLVDLQRRELEIKTVGHPWFQTWITRCFLKSEYGQSRNEISQITRDIQFRRSAALAWFSDLESSSEFLSRREWLIWCRLHPNFKKNSQLCGPIETWFTALTQY